MVGRSLESTEASIEGPGESPEVPAPESWTDSMAWSGSPPRPVTESLHELPADAAFVRAEIELTVSKPIGPGMYNQTAHTLPGLLRLEKGKPVEAHLVGPDGKCWTYRANRVCRKTRWLLFVGSTLPAQDPAPIPEEGAPFIEYVMVQSLLPMHGSGKYVSFMIHDDGRTEDFSKAADPDPND